ncbi:TadE/TadG family type IV pilus assembly protein [Mesobacillus harenae]|uniref:TadE/TadG family type IV pilus assembly protein n=1 Tax=Mesobacillus harenae TaxID=2213203 RepID=UPI0015810567|nr:TadE family protein [Mesobacillus harenae]
MKSEEGQSLVEFALVIPLLLLLLFGIIDFARVFHVYLTMDQAGREAARAASIHRTTDAGYDAAIHFGSSISLNTGHVDVIFDDPANPSGKNVEVLITYPVSLITPIIGNFFADDFELVDSTEMRVE